MHMIMINASPRVTKNSNTEIIIQSFIKGFLKSGEHEVKIYHLVEESTWKDIREAIYRYDHIMFALPMYVENIPGIMIEFLETLDIEKMKNKTMYFILQGGFAEASQFRCCEAYLEKLPGYFSCMYGGTLIKGDMFILHELSHQKQQKEVKRFYDMGITFASSKCFDKNIVTAFAKPEYFSKKMIVLQYLMRPLQKMIFRIFAHHKGCKIALDTKPYEERL